MQNLHSFFLKEELQRSNVLCKLHACFWNFQDFYTLFPKKRLHVKKDAYLTFSTYSSNNQLSFVTSFFLNLWKLS